MRRYKIISYTFILIFLTGVLSACGNDTNADQEDEESNYTPETINIGTAGTGGAYYPVGIAISDILSNELEINTTAQVTGGALENVELTQQGETEISITQSAMASLGYEGESPYKDKNEDIATLFNGLSKGVFHLVVLKSSGIDSIEDLKGKKVVLGPAGGALEVIANIFEAHDIGLDEIKQTFVSYDEGVTMLADNNVDAVIVQSAAPAPALKELEASKNGQFKLLSFEKEKMEELLDEYKYFDSIELPADMYGTDEDTNTIYVTNMMIVKKSLDDDFVYDMTKKIFENIDKVNESHPAAKDLSLEDAATNVPIQLHPGAKKYFEEEGVLEE